MYWDAEFAVMVSLLPMAIGAAGAEVTAWRTEVLEPMTRTGCALLPLEDDVGMAMAIVWRLESGPRRVMGGPPWMRVWLERRY